MISKLLVALLFFSQPETPLNCNPQFQNAAGMGWALTHWGQTIREVAFRVDRINGELVVGKVKLGEPTGHHIGIPITPDTIAVWHNHTVYGMNTPSPQDMDFPIPNYVMGQDGLYVTIPGMHSYEKAPICTK